MVTARAATHLPGLGQTLRTPRRGVLPYQRIRRLVEAGQLTAGETFEEGQFQPASVDLRLGASAIQVRASFLPGRKARVAEVAEGLAIQTLDLTREAVLQREAVYIIPLLEAVSLPPSLVARANPKSTTGRLDVFARLITDYADQFDSVERGYQGQLYIEVAPKTFSVRVRQGTKLNQLRFFQGVAAGSDASRKAARSGEVLVYDKVGEPLKANVARGLWLTVDLANGSGEPLGWRALRNAPVVDFDRVDYYDPLDYWEPVNADRRGGLILQPGDFYLLGSRERVRVPADFAAEMVPYDPAMGEFRVHYAGFFDPGFGYGEGERQGTRAILEVRSHDVPYVLRDGQRIARLVYESLLEPPERLYGSSTSASYQDQQIGLGKQFQRGPSR